MGTPSPPWDTGAGLAEATARILGAPAGTTWVGIDGLGAAGKTTLAHRLAAALTAAGRGTAVVAVDDFARPGLAGWDRDRFAHEVLAPLLADRPARYRIWDFETDRASGTAEIDPGTTVLVEGVSATDDRVPVPWLLRIWIDAPDDLRHRRARERDGEQVWRQWWLPDWLPGEQRYLAEQDPRSRADLVIAGS